MGRLDDFQRHKVRVWSTYPLSAVQRSRNPGYARLPGSGTNGSQTLFFAGRGSEAFAGYGLIDLAITCQVPVWRSLDPRVKVEVLNALNNDKLIGWDTTIAIDPASALDTNGLPTGFVRGARFGTATSTAHFPRPGMTQPQLYIGENALH